MSSDDTYFGLKEVSIKVLWGQSIYDLGTGTLWYKL